MTKYKERTVADEIKVTELTQEDCLGYQGTRYPHELFKEKGRLKNRSEEDDKRKGRRDQRQERSVCVTMCV